MARYRRRRARNQKLAASAIAACLLLAAASHGHRPAAPAAPASVVRHSGGNEALANQMAAAAPYHWAGSQRACLDALWTRESSFRTSATNPTSGAYGIPQALPAVKMAAAGPNWRTDPATQIRWGLAYIAATYGTPCTAWAHEEADSWY